MRLLAGVSILLLASSSLAAQAGVTGKCTLKGKPLAFVDAYAAMAPDPFEEKQKVPMLWFATKPLDHGLLARAKPGDIDDAVTEQAFDLDSATMELRLDAAGKVVEGLQLYVPPGNNRSLSSNEVGKLQLKAPMSARASGSFVLGDDEDLKCELRFDIPIGGKAAPAVAAAAPAGKAWGAALPAGGGEPGKAYLAMHRATLAGDVEAMLKLATKARGDEMRKARSQPDFAKMVKLIQAFEPSETQVVSGRADASRAELQVAGKDSDGGAMTGDVSLLLEAGQWKIEKVSTRSKK
jgi:hypothetical protein